MFMLYCKSNSNTWLFTVSNLKYKYQNYYKYNNRKVNINTNFNSNFGNFKTQGMKNFKYKITVNKNNDKFDS